jgi:SAM-dependent methyltransferase
MADRLDTLREWLDDEPANVIGEVSPHDNMHARNRHWYDRAGQVAVRQVRLAMLTAGKDQLASILDFGCGHGRVMRTLKAAFPEAALTACDINRDGVDFCARTFGATPVYSSPDPAEISIDDRFDLIFCNSFFTHVDLDGWNRFLPYLESLLAQHGLFIFTTAGRRAVDKLRDQPERWMLRWMLREDIRAGFLEDYTRDGFAHRETSNSPGWGYTAAAPSWVCGRIQDTTDLRLLGIAETKNIDTFTCMRALPQ